MRHWFSRKDDQVQGRLAEGRARGTTKKPPLVLMEGVGYKYSCTRKCIGGVGGRQKVQGTPRASTKFKITDQRKSKIIEGVAVSRWDTPHPPLPSTNNHIV